MYRIDKNSNDVVKLQQRLFSDLKIRERDHLQEWIAKNPEMLGEDLLIIQKEYAGFNDTKERLDLLALDKDGGLVVIENKLDDSGRDVVWQALKYASYCSTLSTKQVLRIYQEYLSSNGSEEDAKENVLDFLQRDEEDLVVNDEDQRIIFVANEYRKEVTSTALWLLDHDIKLQCFKTTPYSMGSELFLQVEQIIPVPETEQFIIDAKEKAKEDAGVSKKVAQTRATLIEFWSFLKSDFEKNGHDYLSSIKAKPVFHIGFTKSGGYFNCNMGRKKWRVEMYISNDSDKKYIDAMIPYEEEINEKFGEKVVFERLDGKRASRIKFEEQKSHHTNQLKLNNREDWQVIADWYRDSFVHFYTVISPYWEKVQSQVKK